MKFLNIHESHSKSERRLMYIMLSMLFCTFAWFTVYTVVWAVNQNKREATIIIEDKVQLPVTQVKEKSPYDGQRCIKCPLGVFRNGFCDMCHIASPDKAREAEDELVQRIKSDPSLMSQFRCPYCAGSGCNECHYKGIIGWKR